MTRARLTKGGTIALLAALSSGCFAIIDEQRVKGPARPIPDEQPTQLQEKEPRAPTVHAVVDGEVVDVAVNANIECRSVQLIPMEREDTIRRQMNGAYGFSVNTAPQFWNIVGAATLGGLGAYFALANCVESSTSTPCTPDETNNQKVLGYVLLGTAAIPVVAAIVNAIRVQDSQETIAIGKERRPGNWGSCATPPIPNRKIDLAIGLNTRMTSQTDAAGHVLFDLGSVNLADEVVPSAANITVEGVVDTTVDIRGMASRARWEQQAATVRAARIEADRHRADDEAWARSGAEECRGPEPTDPDIAATACDVVQSYLSGQPTGGHVAEAREVLTQGRARIVRLRAEIEKRRNERVAAERRQAELERRQEAQDRERRIAACRGGCVKGCKERGDFVSCVQKCQENCGP
jgi:hypothetical protein